MGQGNPSSLWKRLGRESCLWRRRGLLELCQRLTKFSELRAGGASIPLRKRCSLTTCLLLGSFCLAQASPSVSADWVWAHTRRLFASVQSRFDTRPPWWFMTPRTCCLSVLAHGVRTKGRRSVCPRTAKLLSWQSSFCAPCLRSRLALARGGPFNEPGLIHRPESPLRGGVRDTKPQMEPSASARTEWVACGADQTESTG